MAAYVPQGDRAERQLFAVGSFSKVLVSFFSAFFSHCIFLGCATYRRDGFIASDEVEMMMCRGGKDKKSSLGDYVHDSVEFFFSGPFFHLEGVSRFAMAFECSDSSLAVASEGERDGDPIARYTLVLIVSFP